MTALCLLLFAAGPPCGSDGRWVETVELRPVERQVCRLVPDVKKVTKVTYETKCVPFCQRRHGWGLLGCLFGHAACPKCTGPFTRRVLVKTETVVEEPVLRCVAETVVEQVPTVVRRKACDAVIPQPAAPALQRRPGTLAR